ncbi:AAA family ATPase [Tenacibaculum finnmarkense genomovar ulcerans]|uniref:AAA family ATPase n=1 Tax=Tenacibaculum finnmarkense TaxID=2781243 RepID=UPI00187B5AAA|nr:AAA family ATPase [Tenacibaculum finnmarkense]MBE7687384.1 AAA family ATPase [Tenacibaculum finnmarkense genomovar ulcerans]
MEAKVKKAYSYDDIAKKNFKTIALTGEWLRHQGVVEQSGSILIYGDSGHGKTTYAMRFMKELTKSGKVFYNTAEEGMRKSFMRSLRLNNMKVVSSKFTFQKEKYDDMVLRLRRKRQPKIVIVDSVQYVFRGKKAADYFNLIEEFDTTLFIFISHVSKGHPEGAVANEIYWDCQNRILIEDFKAIVEKSRCGADEITPLIVNEQKARDREFEISRKG